MVLVIDLCLMKHFEMGMGMWEFINIKRQLSHGIVESMVLVIVFCLIKNYKMGMGLWEFINIKRQLSHGKKTWPWSLCSVQ